GSDTPFDVQVRAGGLCDTVGNIADGTNVHVAELPSTRSEDSRVGCDPGCKTIDLNDGRVDITAARGVEKSVTFTNETNLGSLRICKAAGTSISNGTGFTFTVTEGSETPFDVVGPAGECRTLTGILDGTNVHVAELPST